LNSLRSSGIIQSMDDLDLTILSVLQANGRITNAELARQVDLAPSSTLERVRRLEEHGLIQGYRALLDPHKLGFQVQAVVLVNLAGHQADPIDAFEEQVRSVPEVKLCLHVTGRYDYLLHVVVRDIDHLRRLVTRNLAAISGVQKQETFLVLSTAKQDQGYALNCLAETRPARRRAAANTNETDPGRPLNQEA